MAGVQILQGSRARVVALVGVVEAAVESASWICPSCARIFLDGEADCPECGQPLVSPDALRISGGAKGGRGYALVGRLLHPLEEEPLAGHFESRRIPLAIRGDGGLLVPEARAEEAKALLETFRAELGSTPPVFPLESTEDALAPQAPVVALERAAPGTSWVSRLLERWRQPRPWSEKGPSLSLTSFSRRPEGLGQTTDLLRWGFGLLFEGMILSTILGGANQLLPRSTGDWLGLLFFYVIGHLGFFVRRDVAVSWRGLEYRLWIPPPITYRRLPVEAIRGVQVLSERLHQDRRPKRDARIYRIVICTAGRNELFASNIGSQARAEALAERVSRVLDRPVLKQRSR